MGAAERLEELLSLDRVRHMTGMGTTFIYGEIKAGRFPRSIRIGRRALWMQSEVQGEAATDCAEPTAAGGWVGGRVAIGWTTKKPLFLGAFLSIWRSERDSNPR